MKGMGKMMKQAQQLQTKMMKMQAELAEKTVETTAGGGMINATDDLAETSGESAFPIYADVNADNFVAHVEAATWLQPCCLPARKYSVSSADFSRIRTPSITMARP